jgi:hypothetical protein
MKKILSILVILSLTTGITAGCARVGSSINGSGKIIDTDLQAENFSSLNVKGPFIIEIVQAPAYRVTLSTDENLINRIKVSIERKTLNLSINAPATFFPTSLKLKVEMPELVALNLSEAASAAIIDFKKVETLMIYLSKKSTLSCSVEAETLGLNIFDGSQVVVKGTTAVLEVDARDASKLDLGELDCSRARVNMTQASEAVVNVTGIVDITLDQASKFYYIGNPVFRETSVTGGSSITHK